VKAILIKELDYASKKVVDMEKEKNEINKKNNEFSSVIK